MANAKEAIREIIMSYENQIVDAKTWSQLDDIISNILGSTRVLIALGYIEEACELQDQCSIALDMMRAL